MANAGRPRAIRMVCVNTDRQTITVYRTNGEINRLPYNATYVEHYERNNDLVGYIPPSPGFVRPDYAAIPLHSASSDVGFGLTRKTHPERKEFRCANCNKIVSYGSERCAKCSKVERATNRKGSKRK